MSATQTADLATVKDLAERWRIQPRAVREVIGRGQLKAMFIGGQWLVRPEDVETFEQSRMNVKPTPKRTRRPRPRATPKAGAQ